MSMTHIQPNELRTCDLCQRRFSLSVYQRHVTENQCLKRNHHRLPFESIKQRSIRIGDKIISVRPSKPRDDVPAPPVACREKRHSQTTKQQSSNNSRRLLPAPNHRQRALEEAKQLLERRTKYKPPWIQQRSKATNEIRPDAPPTHPTRSEQRRLTTIERPSPPTTKFKNDDLPVKGSSGTHQPTFTLSPKQTKGASQPVRKASTWTRPSNVASIRDVISPIHIPTFAAPPLDRAHITVNQNYDDDDEFERYSPTPPSTPNDELTAQPSNRIPNSTVVYQRESMARPITYQKSKPHRRRYVHFESRPSTLALTTETVRLPPIQPYARVKQPSADYLRPWR